MTREDECVLGSRPELTRRINGRGISIGFRARIASEMHFVRIRHVHVVSGPSTRQIHPRAPSEKDDSRDTTDVSVSR